MPVCQKRKKKKKVPARHNGIARTLVHSRSSIFWASFGHHHSSGLGVAIHEIRVLTRTSKFDRQKTTARSIPVWSPTTVLAAPSPEIGRDLVLSGVCGRSYYEITNALSIYERWFMTTGYVGATLQRSDTVSRQVILKVSLQAQDPNRLNTDTTTNLQTTLPFYLQATKPLNLDTPNPQTTISSDTTTSTIPHTHPS